MHKTVGESLPDLVVPFNRETKFHVYRHRINGERVTAGIIRLTARKTKLGTLLIEKGTRPIYIDLVLERDQSILNETGIEERWETEKHIDR